MNIFSGCLSPQIGNHDLQFSSSSLLLFQKVFILHINFSKVLRLKMQCYHSPFNCLSFSNYISFQVPVQRVTRYPLLLSRLLKVTPGGHSDKEALQESREMLEQGLDTMNQETNRDTGTTKLWRRISMINTNNRRTENQIDLLGSTTWGVRKVNIVNILY